MTQPDGDRNETETRRTLGALLRRPYEALSRRVYGELAARGFADIRMAHSAVFRHIAPRGSRLTDLAERAGMAKQSMAYLVETLTAGGYVSSAPDPSDGRARLVRLTPRGQAVFATLVELSAAAETASADVLGVERMVALRTLLEELAQALEESPPLRGNPDAR